MARIAGRVAVVTGAGSGIGRAIALRFAAEGATVLAADLSGAQDTIPAPDAGRIEPIGCDVSNPDDVKRLFETCKNRHGRLDILINNAGVAGQQKPLHETSLEDWDRVMNINLRGAFAVLKFGLPLMIKGGGGAVVNTASIGSFRAAPNSVAYITSKGGMLMLTKAAALEYAQDNIRVNAICPGTTLTGILSSATPELMSFLEGRIPMGRLGTSEEMASLALFLASDEASYITGAYFIADGGICAGTGRPPRVERHIE